MAFKFKYLDSKLQKQILKSFNNDNDTNNNNNNNEDNSNNDTNASNTEVDLNANNNKTINAEYHNIINGKYIYTNRNVKISTLHK